jgi:hypothetical protein
MDKEIISPYPEFLKIYTAWKQYGEPEPDQDLIARCLGYSYITGESLPKEAEGFLFWAFEIINRGHDSPLFTKPLSASGQPKSPDTHPDKRYLQPRAVSYVKTCRRMNWNDKAVNTICEQYGVHRSTYHKWERKYPTARDDLTPEGAQQVLDALAEMERQGRLH